MQTVTNEDRTLVMKTMTTTTKSILQMIDKLWTYINKQTVCKQLSTWQDCSKTMNVKPVA